MQFTVANTGSGRKVFHYLHHLVFSGAKADIPAGKDINDFKVTFEGNYGKFLVFSTHTHKKNDIIRIALNVSIFQLFLWS